MLLRDPASAWLTAGETDIDQRHKHLPCVNKDVLMRAIQKWIELHFYPPCSGFDPEDEDTHLNLMEPFVAFVWAFYTRNHKPTIPALTDVGRFIFTYIWRMQHPLMR